MIALAILGGIFAIIPLGIFASCVLSSRISREEEEEERRKNDIRKTTE